MRSLIDRARAWTRSDAGGSMSAILRANIAMQAMSLLFVPILTRVYGPEQYGLFALFVTLSAYFAQVAILRYDVAIDLPDSDEDALALLHLCFLLTGISALAALLFALFAGDLIGRLMGRDDLSDMLVYLPLSIILSSFGALLTAWFSRQRNFQAPANIRLVMGLVDGLGKLGFGVAGILKFGQVFGILISNAVFVVLSLVSARRNHYALIRGFDLKRSLSAGWTYRKFPLLNFPTMILEMTALSLPPVLIGIFFGPVAVGLFFVADRLTQAPAAAIASAVRPVFKRHAAIAINETGQCRPLFRQTLLLTGGIAVCTVIGLVVGAPLLFAYVFKPEWQGAVWMVQILAAARAMDIFVNPVTPLMLVRQTHLVNLAIQIGTTVAAAGALALGGIMSSLVVAVACYTVALCLKYVAELIVCYRLSAGLGDAPAGA